MKHIFRSWNEDLKCFFYFKDGKYYQTLEKYITGTIDPIEFWSNAEQLSDSKDMNNNNLFVGDMIEVEKNKNKYIGKVCYEGNHFFLRLKYIGKEYIPWPMSYEPLALSNNYVLIGNTHQNPELLEG
jgi:hypothetical protein